ncbi:MAG: acyl-CoA desaturase [Thermoleophilaceae bacterium]|nr:acyl-CoA desaturase [Thermoleophilaceae bacterium]
MATMIESPLAKLTDEQIEELGKEFDAIHDDVFAELGDRDRRYITSMIEMHRRLVVMSRLILLGSRFKPAWVTGTSMLSLAKILENMEIGHNVMHGQWDWMNDPSINSSSWDWDSASTAEAWKHSHNYVHHTYTNIRGKDRDLGYEIMRIDPHQKWNPVYLAQPVYNLALAALFEWGVALHDLDFDAIKAGEKSKQQLKRELKGMAAKGRQQITKDYLVFPVLSGLAAVAAEVAVAAVREQRQSKVGGAWTRARRRTSRKPGGIVREVLEGGAFQRTFKTTLKADVTANIVRNVWAYAIIFCGHFPDQTYTFSEKETDEESRGGFYVRQLLGAANIEGSPMFHVVSGNLGYQVEHHLYPDMPSTRYAEIAPRVKELCERYELPYNTGPFLKQLGAVQRTILRLAFPGGKPRDKPGPYRGPDAALAPLNGNGKRSEPTGANGSGPEQSSAGVRVSMPDDG